VWFACRGRCIKKKFSDAVIEEAAKHLGKPIMVFATTDEHRMKSVTRRVWAPIGVVRYLVGIPLASPVAKLFVDAEIVLSPGEGQSPASIRASQKWDPKWDRKESCS
jgi:hypothetical protein